MAEAARQLDRTGEIAGANVVRRLIARPIRLEHARHVAEAETPVQDESEDEAGEAAAPERARDVAALEAELALLKAVLEAERREGASLRARLADPASGSDLGDGPAVRERWAALVDDLLLRLR